MAKKNKMFPIVLVAIVALGWAGYRSAASCYTSQSATCITNGECVEENDGGIKMVCSGSVCKSVESGGKKCCTNESVTVMCSRQIIDWHYIDADWACTYTDIDPAEGYCVNANLSGDDC